MADFFVSMKDEALSYQGVTRLRGGATPDLWGVFHYACCLEPRVSGWRHPRFVGCLPCSKRTRRLEIGVETPPVCGVP